jgi:RNA polymerase sigma factor (sigma-70 family)
MIWQDGYSGMPGHTDPEEEREVRLAAQARAGAEWALGALIARYQPPVTRYLTRLSGNAEFARHEAEQIFMRMERRIRGPQGGYNLRLWLLRACTEAGLDYLRAPNSPRHVRLAEPKPAGLLTERAAGAAQRLRSGMDTLAGLTGTTGRQVRSLIFPSAPAAKRPPAHASPSPPEAHGGQNANTNADADANADDALAHDAFGSVDPDIDTQTAHEELRHRLIRAVLAEMPYGDAQCLALHLVAGLNQAQVARALGITNSAARRRIVQGLQIFARRYEAAAASLGLPPEPEPARGYEATAAATTFAPMEASEEQEITAQPVPAVLADEGHSWPTVAESASASDDEGPGAQAAASPLVEEDEQPWMPEVTTVVEPRHEIIVDATPPDTADSPEAADELATALDDDRGQSDVADAAPAALRHPAPRVIEGTVAAVRVVPALTPLPLPEPQLPVEPPPAVVRWSAARAVPVLTGPLRAVRDEAGPQFAAEPQSVRRIPVLTEQAAAAVDAPADHVGTLDGSTVAART